MSNEVPSWFRYLGGPPPPQMLDKMNRSPHQVAKPPKAGSSLGAGTDDISHVLVRTCRPVTVRYNPVHFCSPISALSSKSRGGRNIIEKPEARSTKHEAGILVARAQNRILRQPSIFAVPYSLSGPGCRLNGCRLGGPRPTTRVSGLSRRHITTTTSTITAPNSTTTANFALSLVALLARTHYPRSHEWSLRSRDGTPRAATASQSCRRTIPAQRADYCRRAHM
jgi:hypothetical protein